MGFVLFHYTLFLLLATILAAAACFSTYLVSHKRTMLFATAGFLFYFFDVAWVFQDDFFFSGTGAEIGTVYVAIRSLASVVTGGGFLIAFWLLVCDYLGETRRALLIAPGVVFFVGSIAVLFGMPESDLQRFIFYSMRGLMLFWTLLFVGVRYVKTKDEVEKTRLSRHRWLYVLMWVLGLMVVAEDAVVFLFPSEQGLVWWPRTYAPERNFSENILVFCCVFFASRDAFRVLAMRFDRPPTQGGRRQEALIDDNLLMYGKRHQLSAREREVLQYILLGNDNQNIASTMHLALSTVKVHVHNILHKTGQPNRQTLIQDFWKTS